MAKKIDMTGWVMKEHGVPNSLITVLTEDTEYQKIHNLKSRAAFWRCKCNCGTMFSAAGYNIRNGHTVSCGCYSSQNRHTNPKNDLIGKKFNKLTVLELTDLKQQGGKVWKCECECGNITFATTHELVSNSIMSCGCLQKQHIKEFIITKKRIDLTGEKFGKLIVIKQLEKDDNDFKKGIPWLCQCECGNLIIAYSTELRKGHKLSCGCLKSIAEHKVIQILNNNNIPFISQHKFSDCRSNKNAILYFDFYINNNFLLECDGEQHYKYDVSGWNTEQSFYDRQERDNIKNEYAKSHNIPLKRIPYWDFDKITLENIMSDRWLINN